MVALTPSGVLDTPTRALAPQTSLAGSIEFGGGATLARAAGCASWPDILHTDTADIAIDGHFVLNDRLFLGHTATQRAYVAQHASTDLRQLFGQFQNSFVNIVVNNREQAVTHLCSDAFGALPLYVFKQPTRYTFASTYAGLAQESQQTLAPDPVGLAELYWFGYPIGNRTAYRDVQLLPPNCDCKVRWSDGEVTFSNRPADKTTPPSLRSMDEAAEFIVATMHRANRRLHRSDLRTGLKISGGMDSRLIAGTWPSDDLHTYTYGFPGAAEVRLAARLANALHMPHTFVPVTDDFFSSLHAPLFGLHGITEFFHQALLPSMLHDDVSIALDGLGGDILFGGLTLKRAQPAWRMAMGLPPPSQSASRSVDSIAEYILQHIQVPDDHYRPLQPEAVSALHAVRDDILQDLCCEVRIAQSRFDTFDDIYADVIFRNRTRRYISLQGTLCRPAVETLYPFLDRELLALRGALRPQWTANKRLYVQINTHHLPAIRNVPNLFSLLPFTMPAAAHFPGRVVRYAAEQAGLRLSYRTGNRLCLWPSNGVQWGRWLTFNKPLREGARAFMRNSLVFDEAAFERDTHNSTAGAQFSGTRFMLTASYCGHFRNCR